MRKIRQQIVILFFLIAMLSGVVAAKANDTNKCGDNLTWNLTDTGVLSITGTGEMYDYSVTDAVYAPWYEQRASIFTIEIGNGVTRIGNDAFYSCSSVTNVSMADSITSIGDRAFQESKLTSIILPENVTTVGSYAFADCKLTDAVLPDSLTYIPNAMFKSCHYLVNVDLPKMIVTVGDSAFEGCSALKSMILPEGLTTIGDKAFAGCGSSTLWSGTYPCSNFTSITLPTSLQSIGDAAFQWCERISSVDIPPNVTKIGEYAFARMNLQSITIPANIQEIGSSAFLMCKKLSTINFLWAAPMIGEGAFADVTATCYYPGNNPDWTEELCQQYQGTLTWVAMDREQTDNSNKCGDNLMWNLTGTGVLSITGTGEMYDYYVTDTVYAPWYEQRASILTIEIGNGVTRIGNDAFYSCSAVTNVSMANTITSIGDRAFYGISAISIELSLALTDIGNSAFQNTKLTSITLPEGVVNIGTYAFADCKLTDAVLPDSLTYIPDAMFYGCYYLVNIDLPERVVTIGNRAFASCAALSSMVLPEGLTTIGEFAFSGCGSSTLWGGTYPCSNFTSITLPSSLQSIGDAAFQWCERISSVDIPHNVTRIGKSAFARTKLKSITIPANIQEIGSSAFYGCKSLSTVNFLWAAPTIGEGAFDEVTATCYYPGNNLDWTEELRQQYKGTLTWIAQEMEETVTYQITYDANEGNGAPEADTKVHGTDILLSSTVPVRKGYSFLGWSELKTATTAEYQPGNIYTDEKDITLYAVWKQNMYNISYDANGGDNAPESQSKVYGKNLVLSSNIPTRVGYTFVGWAESATATSAVYSAGGSYIAEKDNVLYAVWKIERYTISYNANGGSNAPESQTKTYGKSLTLTSEVPVRAGHTFVGWAESAASTSSVYQAGGNYTSEKNITLYAVWKINTYTITYNSNGGSEAPAKQTKTYGVDLKLSNVKLIQPGYTFLGWAKSAAASSAVYQPAGTYATEKDVTLYAVWKLNTYKVTYQLNGGTGNIIAQTKNHGEALELSSEKPVKDGYVFLGWSAKEESLDVNYQAGGKYALEEDIVLYAVWEKEKIIAQKQTISVKTSITREYKKNSKFKLGATAKTKLTYKSTNKKVVTVSNKGVVTVKGYGSAKIKITAAATAYYKKASKTVKISIVPGKVTKLKVTSPDSGRLMISWKKSKQVDGYEIQYSTSKKFVAGKTTSGTASAKSTYAKAKDLKSGKTYYVRICGYKTVKGVKVYGLWSDVKKIKIK